MSTPAPSSPSTDEGAGISATGLPLTGDLRQSNRPLSVDVRLATRDDIAQLINLQFEVYPPSGFPPVNRWNASSLEHHQRVFSSGQLIAEVDGRIIGASTTMMGRSERFERPHRFLEIIGSTRLEAHDPNGDALYGVDICVSPHFRRRGVGRALYEARFALQAAHRLPYFYAGARVPGFGALKDTLSIEQYIDEVKRGVRHDATLSVQLELGFEAVCPLHEYLQDPETANYAVLIRRLARGGET
jgi:GNAT superfamily N-acetyltransferase